VELVFNEETRLLTEDLRLLPDLSVVGIPGPGMKIILQVEDQVPGELYTLEATAQDSRGNTLSFLAEFYGFNPRVPKVLLNELTPRGSEAHPDLVEIKVTADGDMGGLVLYQGTPGEFENRFTFPSFPVRRGDFLLVHFKPEGDSGETNETVNKKTSRGIDASDSAFDFWIKDGKGLGGNNGVLSLYERPGGGILDGILYSNRTSSSDQAYRGFGSSSMLARAEELVKDGGWKIAGNRISPEDGVNPEDSSSTRSLCRSSRSLDTDGKADWHIVPTRKSSFGKDNGDEIYKP
jgi:hypothetical protein